MKCPSCGNEMHPGKLHSGGESIFWSAEGKKGLKKFFGGSTNLVDFLGNVPGFHCGQCGFLVIPHEKLKDQQ